MTARAAQGRLSYTNAGDDRTLVDCPLCRQAARVDLHGGRLVFRCFGGCDPADVAAAMRSHEGQLIRELSSDTSPLRSLDQTRARKGRGVSRTQLLSEPPLPGSSREEIASWLTVALGLGGDPVVAAERYGRSVESRLVLLLASGQRITLERIADAFEPGKLVPAVMAATGAQVAPYNRADTTLIAGSMIRLGDLLTEDDARGEAVEWGRTFLEGAVPNGITVTNFSSPGGRWEALSALDRRPNVEPYSEPAERAALAIDGATGHRMVRTSDFGRHARSLAGRPLAWAALHGRMVEVGWKHWPALQQRRPGGPEKKQCRVYVIPAGWEHE
jgi:hypothetical protein